MLHNLKQAILTKNLSREAIAATLGISGKSLFNKIQGSTEFTVSEAMKLRDNVFPEYDFSYLFTQKASTAS